MRKRFAVFIYDEAYDCYAGGGWNDLHGLYASLDEAKAVLLNQVLSSPITTGHVVDLDSATVVFADDGADKEPGKS